MTNYESLPGAANLSPSAREELPQGDPIVYDPDKHVLSIVAGRRPKIRLTNIEGVTEQEYAVSPAYLVSASVKALLDRTDHSQQHASLLLSDSSQPDIRITLDPINIDAIMEQLLISDVSNHRSKSEGSQRPFFGEFTSGLISKSTQLVTQTVPTSAGERQGVLSWFTNGDEERTKRVFVFDETKAHQSIQNLAHDNDLASLQKATLGLFWAMLGDQYFEAFKNGAELTDKQGNRRLIMEALNKRIRINFDGSDQPILIGDAIFDGRLVANLFVDIDGVVELEGVDGDKNNNATWVSAYRAYSIDEIQDHLPLLLIKPQEILTQTKTTDYGKRQKNGYRWSPASIPKTDLTITRKQPDDDDTDRLRVYITMSNQTYTAGTFKNYEDEYDDKRHSRVVLRKSNMGRRGKIVATNINGLEIAGNFEVEHHGCTLV